MHGAEGRDGRYLRRYYFFVGCRSSLRNIQRRWISRLGPSFFLAERGKGMEFDFCRRGRGRIEVAYDLPEEKFQEETQF